MSEQLNQLLLKKISIESDIPIGDLVSAMHYEDAAKVILAIDLAQACADFTEEAIKELFKSILGDIGDGKELIKELKKINKEYKKGVQHG